MEELEQAELSAEETASAEGQGETEAEQEAAESEREEGSEESSEEKGKQKPPRGLLKKIGKLTRQKYELLETNNELRSRLDAIEKRLDSKKAEEPEAKPKLSSELREEDYPDYRSFVRAVARAEAREEYEAQLKSDREREYKQSEEAEQREVVDAYNRRANEARQKYDDYDEALEAASTEGARVDTFQAVAETIYQLDNGPDVAYYLAKHAEERAALLGSSPTRARVQLARIAAALAESEESEEEEPEEIDEDAEPEEEEAEVKPAARAPQKKQTAAPKPIKPVRKAAPTATGLSDDLPIDEWMKRRQKQG